VGDGTTKATLQVVTDQGAAKPKVKAARGRIGVITPVVGGALIEFIPPPVTEPTTLTIDVAFGKDKFKASVDVVPAWTGTFDVSFDPPVLPSTQTSSIKVRPTSRTAQADARRQLRIHASSGAVTPLVPTGDGSWIATYTPPADLANPMQAVFAITDATAPLTIQGHAALPVTVSKSMTFDAPADSTAVLRVGNREFGPMKANPGGRVAIDVDMHPAHTTGTLQTVTADGQRASTDVQLPMTVTPSPVIQPLPDKLPSGTVLPVTVFCKRPDGGTCLLADVKLSASAGAIASATESAPGVFSANWTMPKSGTAVLTADVGGGKSTVDVEAVPGRRRRPYARLHCRGSRGVRKSRRQRRRHVLGHVLTQRPIRDGVGVSQARRDRARPTQPARVALPVGRERRRTEPGDGTGRGRRCPWHAGTRHRPHAGGSHR
jgi:hypothetical protein